MYPQRTTGRNTNDPWLASLMTGKTAAMSPVPESRTEFRVVSLICIKFNLTKKYPRRNGKDRWTGGRGQARNRGKCKQTFPGGQLKLHHICSSILTLKKIFLTPALSSSVCSSNPLLFPSLKPVPMPYPHAPVFSQAGGGLASSAGEHRHPHYHKACRVETLHSNCSFALMYI